MTDGQVSQYFESGRVRFEGFLEFDQFRLFQDVPSVQKRRLAYRPFIPIHNIRLERPCCFICDERNNKFHTFFNTLSILPELREIGVSAIKVEGRQRSPAYVGHVTAVMRAAIDECMKNPSTYRPKDQWMQKLATVSEGSQTTLGAYHRPWQ